MSLQFISSTYHSVALNLVPCITFVLALIFHQEKLMFWSMNGQAKIWGLGISLGGALALLLWKGPVVVKVIRLDTSNGIIGWTLIIVALLVCGFGNILMVRFGPLLLRFFLNCFYFFWKNKENKDFFFFFFFVTKDTKNTKNTKFREQ